MRFGADRLPQTFVHFITETGAPASPNRPLYSLASLPSAHHQPHCASLGYRRSTKVRSIAQAVPRASSACLCRPAAAAATAARLPPVASSTAFHVQPLLAAPAPWQA